MNEPLAPDEARRLIRAIVQSGQVATSKHARAELKADGLDLGDCLNALRGGVVEPAELENGSWRYRVRTARMFVVVAFRSKAELRIVTAWRLKK